MKWHEAQSAEAQRLAPRHPMELVPFSDGSPPIVARCADYVVGAGGNGMFAFIADRRYDFAGWWHYEWDRDPPLNQEQVKFLIGYGNLRRSWFAGRPWKYEEIQV